MSKIVTDHKWKPFKTADEVPRRILVDEFDWLDEDNRHDLFIRYHGRWYHLSEFLQLEGLSEPKRQGWHGYYAESGFMSTLIKVSDDGESYQIGRYLT